MYKWMLSIYVGIVVDVMRYKNSCTGSPWFKKGVPFRRCVISLKLS